MINMWVGDNPINKCCARPNIKKFHNTPYLSFSGEVRNIINSVCLSCGGHWHGLLDNVDFFTIKEWDVFVSCESEIFSFRLHDSKFKHPNELFKKYFINGVGVIDS